MHKILLLAGIGLFSFAGSVVAQNTAQKANTDSLSLVVKISEDQLKLAKLQNTVEQKTKDKKYASEKAQQSANDNAIAAARLNEDPENKKLAGEANDKAGIAKSDARKGRKAADQLDALNKDIQDLKLKIAGEQSKLDTYMPAKLTVAPTAPTPLPVDTTQHP
jgi:hypothetical protein